MNLQTLNWINTLNLEILNIFENVLFFWHNLFSVRKQYPLPLHKKEENYSKIAPCRSYGVSWLFLIKRLENNQSKYSWYTLNNKIKDALLLPNLTNFIGAYSEIFFSLIGAKHIETLTYTFLKNYLASIVNLYPFLGW